jgi:hypothetical protein
MYLLKITADEKNLENTQTHTRTHTSCHRVNNIVCTRQNAFPRLKTRCNHMLGKSEVYAMLVPLYVRA